MVPQRIWLAFNGYLVSVRTNTLEIVQDLMLAAKNGFPISLRDVEPPSITLHTTEHAEALDSGLALAEIAAQLTPCAARETPLIVKGKPPFYPHPNSGTEYAKLKLSLYSPSPPDDLTSC
jgi:hypothetical protein